MSASGYVALQPGIILMQRLDNNVPVMVNLRLARTVEPLGDGMRVMFGPNEFVDVRMSMAELGDLVQRWQAG
jgi:hypothetical protein